MAEETRRRHAALDDELAWADHERGSDAERMWRKCEAAGKDMVVARWAATKWREQTIEATSSDEEASDEAARAATEKQLRRLERAEEEADRERRRTAAERVAAEQELQRLNREEGDVERERRRMMDAVARIDAQRQRQAVAAADGTADKDDPCPNLKRRPGSYFMRIDPDAERRVWRMRHAMEAPPNGDCVIISCLAHCGDSANRSTLMRMATAVRQAAGLGREYLHEKDKWRLEAYLGIRTATIVVTPGEPIYGMVLGPLRPGTRENDHEYALIRRVADNHCSPFGERLGLQTWDQLQDLADEMGMQIIQRPASCTPRESNSGTHPAQPNGSSR